MPRKPLTPQDIARRRVIEHIDIANGKGLIRANGRRFQFTFDDVLDLVQCVEMVMLKLTGKVLATKFRPQIRNRAALKPTSLIAGDYSLYAGDSPVERFYACPVTERVLKSHYLRIDIGGDVWDNWFCRLDELVKCLYIVVAEAQADPPRIYMQRTARVPKQIYQAAQSAAIH